MPLSFQSISHGEVAFGFFNIETDMILLNRYFFFAADFCADIARMSATGSGGIETIWASYILEEKDIGNLMAAIHGIEFRGFIGDTYRLSPFPEEQWAFKQNPEGHKTRAIIKNMIKSYAALSTISVKVEATGATIAIGEYLFSRLVFHDLLRYVWAGGYPRWKDGVRPDYVLEMTAAVERSSHPLFGLQIEEDSIKTSSLPGAP